MKEKNEIEIFIKQLDSSIWCLIWIALPQAFPKHLLWVYSIFNARNNKNKMSWKFLSRKELFLMEELKIALGSGWVLEPGLHEWIGYKLSKKEEATPVARIM